MAKEIIEYNDENVDSLTDIEAFRHRPTVYMQDIGFYGNMHIFKEVVTNSIDEYLSGFGNVIEIFIDPDNKLGPSFTVKDYGRGIPLGKLKDSVSKKNTSGKYTDIENKGSGGYKQSGGINGLGLKLLNAVSKNFKATSARDGERWTTYFDEGIETKEIFKEKYEGPSGTIISYIPDIKVLKDIDISDRKSDFATYLEIVSYVNPGVSIVFNWGKDKVIKYYHPNGTMDYFNKIVSEKRIHILGKSNHVKYSSEDGDVGYDIVYGFADKGGGNILSFVNGLVTVDGGEHVVTLSEAMGVLTSTLNKGNYIPKSISNNVKITGNEIRESLFGIVIAHKVSPKFDTQVKSKFSSKEFKPLVINQLKNHINEWIKDNQPTIDKIGSHLALLAKIKYENSKNKDKILKSGSSKTDLFKNIDVKKFADCNKNDPSRSELFLCEGDSAASSIKSGRDRDYQAIFALRGKVKNVIKSDDLSEELVTLVKILGIGIGDDKDIRKLRYRRIIIMTDADADGYHISSLLIAFFFRFYPELIANGNILLAKPPLYTLKSKNSTIFINNHDQLNYVLTERSIRIFDIIDKDDNVLPIGVAKYYMEYLPDYADMMDDFANKLTIDPLLLEAIVMNFKDIMKGDAKNLKYYKDSYNNKFEMSSFKILDNGIRVFSFDKGYEHFYVRIDKSFTDNVIVPIANFIKNKIKLARIRLVGRVSGKKYSEYYYEQGKLIYNSLFGANSGMVVTRSKGLGSSQVEDLVKTSMDPKTRYLIQLKSTDNHETYKVLENMFTNSSEKKLMFSVNANM